jgi:hypothetical protein
MARSAVSFIPSFVNYLTTAPSIPTTKPFNTTRTGQDRVSAPVKIDAMHFDKVTNSIKVFCSDGNLRECRVSRLTSLDAGRQLWKQLQEIGKAEKEVQFVAAGGFSPDKWFYTVQ